MISVSVQGEPHNITVIQVYVPTTNAKEDEVELFYEDLPHLFTNAKKRYPFHHGGLKCKIRKSTGKIGLGVQNKATQRLAEFCQATHWSQQTPFSNIARDDFTYEYHQIVSTEIRLIIFFVLEDGEALYRPQKQDWELTVAQIISSLLPNSDLN